MGKLINPFEWSKTTLRELFEETEATVENQFDIVEMELADGRSVVMALIAGIHAQPIAQLLREAKETANDV
ncbi:hypothetical protein [Chromobacterium sp. IIBBL 290-4]|uniref:hypothetical protein n=1 Tax=Chromobacterium sp. IIBBL 290-4 TaxID=2953890 RepID=UPI0020B72A91|nr:hypothetical protein [Chromobacterium sp. IIBBL 290-4]UTH73526.1 hypothetical protein NKT35_18595 [Chromobacterium sp. IIBBL 290-4]